MSENQERAVLVALAVLGAFHEIWIRQQVADRMLGGDQTPPRAQAYHGAMTLYRRAALFFGRRALEAEASYYKEMERASHG